MAVQLKSVSSAGHDAIALKESPWNITPEDFFTNTEILRKSICHINWYTSRQYSHYSLCQLWH